jgi:polyferredoxin
VRHPSGSTLDRRGTVVTRERPDDAGSGKLRAIKAVHTVIWAFFAACILAIPVASWAGHFRISAWLAAIVLVEVAVLLLNSWSCPLTAVAARYTPDRDANFDIYLPRWLARHNKSIFGFLYVAGVAFAALQWARSAG